MFRGLKKQNIDIKWIKKPGTYRNYFLQYAGLER